MEYQRWGDEAASINIRNEQLDSLLEYIKERDRMGAAINNGQIHAIAESLAGLAQQIPL